jgi:predicted DCC family thiol-disulfide oxidoreductase YuxK
VFLNIVQFNTKPMRIKSLQHKVILYDDVCPLCKTYTRGFVSMGWLLPEHRIGFSEAPEALLERIDLDRARHEIPLHDTESGETLYGKDALFFIIGAAMPFLKPLFRLRGFRMLVFGLYQLITYNRRIIAGSKKPDCGFDCAPDFNGFYRWSYIFIVLSGAAALFYGMVSQAPIEINSLAAFGLLLGIGLLRGFFYSDWQHRTSYFGHLATVTLLVVLAFQCLGLNAWTLSLVPASGAYLLAKRVEVLQL